MCWAATLLLAGSAPIHAATPEALVKAAYLHKIASFVRWPVEASVDDSFRMCVAGRDDIADVLELLTRDERIGGRQIGVSRIGAAQSDQAGNCQILFVGRGPETARSLLAATGNSPVLTVTDRSTGTRGGAIEFLIRDGRVRFAINRSRAEARRLEFSAKLLEVAVEVER
jgi:hypothetical protein